MWSARQPVTVSITDDQLQQGNRSFSLVLSIKPTNLNISVNRTRRTVTIAIVDDGKSNIKLIYKLLDTCTKKKGADNKNVNFSLLIYH